MKHTLLPAIIVLSAASCAGNKNPYDTGAAPRSAATPTAAQAAAQPAASYGDAIYGSQPLYGDGSANTAAPTTPPVPVNPPVATGSAPVNPPAPSAALPPSYQNTPAVPTPSAVPAGGLTHVVAKGDTLSGIAAKYKVPMASIKAANNMTADTVVLGKKLVIPAR